MKTTEHNLSAYPPCPVMELSNEQEILIYKGLTLPYYPECSVPASPASNTEPKSDKNYQRLSRCRLTGLGREVCEKYLWTEFMARIHDGGIAWNRSTIQANIFIQ
jgi:hypothetical protein